MRKQEYSNRTAHILIVAFGRGKWGLSETSCNNMRKPDYRLLRSLYTLQKREREKLTAYKRLLILAVDFPDGFPPWLVIYHTHTEKESPIAWNMGDTRGVGPTVQS